jgi:hypothetical protein
VEALLVLMAPAVPVMLLAIFVLFSWRVIDGFIELLKGIFNGPD